MVYNTWSLEGRGRVTTCSCADNILAASSPPSGTIGPNVPGGSGVDTTLIINPYNFLLHAARHKYFPHILAFVCFWTNMFVLMCMKWGLSPQWTTYQGDGDEDINGIQELSWLKFWCILFYNWDVHLNGRLLFLKSKLFITIYPIVILGRLNHFLFWVMPNLLSTGFHI